FEEWRVSVGMIAQILVQGLVAHYDAKSSARVHIDGFLEIQLVRGSYLLGGFRSTLLDGNEMYLAVHEPIVGHAIYGAVFQIKPHQVAVRSEEHTSELQSRFDLVCRLLL